MERYNFVEAFNDLSKLYEEVNKKEIKEAFGDEEVEVSAVPVVVAAETPSEATVAVTPEVNELSCVETTANEVMLAYQNAAR